jgi:hypothetical protein
VAISDKSSINILVVYHSQTGHTGKMAEAVAEGDFISPGPFSLFSRFPQMGWHPNPLARPI